MVAPAEALTESIRSDSYIAELVEAVIGPFSAYAIVPADTKKYVFESRGPLAEFCAAVRTRDEGRTCIDCDSRTGQEAGKAGHAIRYMCHAGLIGLAAPIVVDGEHRATIFCGQRRPASDGEDTLAKEKARETERRLDFGKNELIRLWEGVPRLAEGEEEQVRRRLNLLSRYIAQSLTKTNRLQEAKDSSDRVLASLQAIAAMHGTLGPQNLFDTIVVETASVLNTMRCALAVRDRPEFGWSVRAFLGDEWASLNLEPCSRCAGWFAKIDAGETVSVAAEDHSIFHTGNVPCSLALLPIPPQPKPCGMLILGTDGRFEGLASKRPVIIETLQTHAGLALNSLLLRRQIQQLTAETIGFAAGALGHTLAASVAHELKNGLQRVNGQVEDIIEKASFSDALAGRGLISKLNAEIARLSSLVNGMFQVSNGLQGFKGIVAQKKWFYLNEIVRDAVQLANVVAATKYDKKGIEVETTLAKELDQPSGISDERLARFNSEFSASAEEPIPHKLPSHPIFADPNQIRQVIINLLINAIEAYQYSGRRQLIHIKTESMKSGLPHHATESVRVEVTDYGCGFTAECRTHLFEIGYTTTGGAGLGLYVVKTLVEDQHGGTLYASSPGVGAGATFGFIIPRHGSNMDYVD